MSDKVTFEKLYQSEEVKQGLRDGSFVEMDVDGITELVRSNDYDERKKIKSKIKKKSIDKANS